MWRNYSKHSRVSNPWNEIGSTLSAQRRQTAKKHLGPWVGRQVLSNTLAVYVADALTHVNCSKAELLAFSTAGYRCLYFKRHLSNRPVQQLLIQISPGLSESGLNGWRLGTPYKGGGAARVSYFWRRVHYLLCCASELLLQAM